MYWFRGAARRGADSRNFMRKRAYSRWSVFNDPKRLALVGTLTLLATYTGGLTAEKRILAETQGSDWGRVQAGRGDGRSLPRVCLATLEFRDIANGGIGTATAELADVLAATGHAVTVLVLQPSPTNITRIQRKLAHRNIDLLVYDTNDDDRDAVAPIDFRVRSHFWQQLAAFRLYQWLRPRQQEFDIVMYHEWFGVGFHVSHAKRQGSDFQRISLVAALHGPHLWALHNQRVPLASPIDLQIDYMEKNSVENADFVLAPSQYIADYVVERGWRLPQTKLRVLPNVMSHLTTVQTPINTTGPSVVSEIVFFGKTSRHKGLHIFCDAVDMLLDKYGTLKDVHITFLVRIVSIDGMSGRAWLDRRARNWKAAGAHLRLRSTLTSDECRAYLSESPGKMAVMPSVMENSPYVVAECMELGIPFLASDVGGTGELVRSEDMKHVMVAPNADAFASAIDNALRSGAWTAHATYDMPRLREAYIRWIAQIAPRRSTRSSVHPKTLSEPSAFGTIDVPDECRQRAHSQRPLISIVIPTYNRGPLLIDAVESALAQTCKSIEVVVVDDASRDVTQQTVLTHLEHSDQARSGVLRIIRQGTNGYLGAARNQGARSARGRFLLFLDDDDLLLPCAAANFFQIIKATAVDVASASPVVFKGTDIQSSTKLMGIADGTIEAKRKPEYWLVPGGPTNAGMLGNVFSGPVFMISRKSFLRLATLDGGMGFSESREGCEDWEFHARAHLAGLKYEKSVLPLYWCRARSNDGVFKNTNVYMGRMHATRPYYKLKWTNPEIDLISLQRLISAKT